MSSNVPVRRARGSTYEEPFRGEQQRHYLFKHVAEFFERVSRTNATVLLLDDLQWADNATLLLLQHLGPLLGEWLLLAAGTYRDVELDGNRPFSETLETLIRKRLAQRVHLDRLPRESVAAMLTALGGPDPPPTLVTAIYQETEGNPFFVEEVFEHLQEEGVLQTQDGSWRSALDLTGLDVPEGVRLVVGRRLQRVSADCRKVLTFGAIVGRGFGLELLEAVGDVTSDRLLEAVEEAEQAYLIMATATRDARWEFSHALIRQTLAEGLSVPRRQRLHLRVADAMERSAASPEAATSDIALHLYQAGSGGPREDRTVLGTRRRPGPGCRRIRRGASRLRFGAVAGSDRRRRARLPPSWPRGGAPRAEPVGSGDRRLERRPPALRTPLPRSLCGRNLPGAFTGVFVDESTCGSRGQRTSGAGRPWGGTECRPLPSPRLPGVGPEFAG